MKTFRVFFLFFFVPFFVPSVFAAEQIDLYSVNIGIHKNGTIMVVEDILYNFGDVDRHGIFRDIPFTKTNSDGKKFVLTFEDITVTDEDSAKYQFEESKEDGQIHLKIGDPDRTITGLHTYRIGYKVRGGITYFTDHDELYWNITGNNWNVPIQVAQARIKLPENLPPDQTQLACFTGNMGNTSADCQIIYANGEVILQTTTPLNTYEGLTAVVGFPKGIVDVVEPTPYVRFFETLLGKIVLVLIAIAAIIWYLITPAIVIYRWWKYGRDPKPAMGIVTAWFDAPKTKGHRRLRPAEAGTLIDETVDTRDIFATIVDLARRGHLTIIETKKEEFTLEKRDGKQDDEVMLPFEAKVFKALFGSSDSVKVKDIKLYQDIVDIQASIYAQVVADGFFSQNPQTIRTLYGVLGGFAFITGNLLLAIISFTFGMAMPRKTLFGAEEAAVAQSLKNFLSSQKDKLAFQAKNQMFFEKFLPYAIAYGVEKIWAERFKDITFEEPDWYRGYGNSNFQSVVFARALTNGLSSSIGAASSTRSSSGFSSGFSGGGSSGGGGGGGGGGSW